MLITARVKSSPQERQKSPLSLWERPPIAVNCISAGFPHHSQRLPRGTPSTETERLNSFSDMRYPPSNDDRVRTEQHFDKQRLRGNPYLVANNSGTSTATRHIQKRASSPGSSSAQWVDDIYHRCISNIAYFWGKC